MGIVEQVAEIATMNPAALREHWERVHSRMQIGMELAQPCSLADAQHLATRRCAGITLAGDLMAKLHEEAKGSARRVVGILSDVRQIARDADITEIDLAQFLALGGRFNTGKSPVRGH